MKTDAEIQAEVDLMLARSKIEHQEEWRKWIDEIPAITFPAEWQIKVIPPFGGAMARFLIDLPDGRGKSVYLDVDDRLGCVGHPYWEVHPCEGHEPGRCDMDDVEGLLALIAGPSE